MNEQIKWITDLLDTHGIPYWIDSGTLLGLMREGDLLRKGRKNPDSDIDIGMWSRHEPRVRSILPLIRRAGFAVRRYSYNKLVYCYFLIPSHSDLSPHSPPVIDLTIYRRHGIYAWSPGYYPGKPDKPSLIRHSNPSSRAWNHLSAILEGLWTIPKIRLPLSFMRRWITVEVCAWPFRLYYNVGTNWIPCRYFDRIERLRDSGILFPQDWQNYLEFRYGDWKTPVEEWRYWVDDRAFQCKTPHEMIKSINGVTDHEEVNLQTERSEATSEL